MTLGLGELAWRTTTRCPNASTTADVARRPAALPRRGKARFRSSPSARSRALPAGREAWIEERALAIDYFIGSVHYCRVRTQRSMIQVYQPPRPRRIHLASYWKTYEAAIRTELRLHGTPDLLKKFGFRPPATCAAGELRSPRSPTYPVRDQHRRLAQSPPRAISARVPCARPHCRRPASSTPTPAVSNHHWLYEADPFLRAGFTHTIRFAVERTLSRCHKSADAAADAPRARRFRSVGAHEGSLPPVPPIERLERIVRPRSHPDRYYVDLDGDEVLIESSKPIFGDTR